MASDRGMWAKEKHEIKDPQERGQLWGGGGGVGGGARGGEGGGGAAVHLLSSLILAQHLTDPTLFKQAKED